MHDITTSPVPVDARAVLEIDLDALRANWAKLNAIVGPAVECAGVVKADAYGLGLERIVRALTHEGCVTFFVATLQEGRQVRQIQAGAHVFILDGLLPGAAEHYVGYNLWPVLSSMPEVEEWAAFAHARNRRFPAALQIETGMNRLGIPIAVLQDLVADGTLLSQFQPVLLMSHLACADHADHPLNDQQREAFDAAARLMPDVPKSLSNSGGTFLGPAFHYDLVRPGIALYGGRAFEGAPNPMQSVVRFSARILQVHTAEAGDTVGYGATHIVNRPTRIATIACGYADGFLRALSGSTGTPGPVGYISDHPVRVVGRVSMDLITLDVSHVPEHLAQRGSWVEIIGNKVTVDDLTDRAGTIGYELLTRLGTRVHRIYLENGEPC